MSISAISSSLDWWEYLKTHGSSAASAISALDYQSVAATDDSTASATDDSSAQKVSETDAATMLAMLSAISGGAQTFSAADSSAEVDSFLDKVQAGTVSDSDLTAMQAALRNAPPPPPPSSAAAEDSSAGSDDLQSTIAGFLEKVKEGTVTDSDLAAMQAALSSAQASSAADSYAASQDSVRLQQLTVAANAYENSYLTNSQQDTVWAI